MQAALRSWRRQRQRIFILPTRAGLGYAVLLIVMWLGAINYNNSLAHMLMFLLVSLALIAMIHSVRNLRNIELQAQGLKPVFAGEPVPIQIDIKTDDRTRYQLQFAGHRESSNSLNPFKWMRGFEPLQTLDEISERRQFATLQLPPRSRGQHTLARLRVASTFPLGLFYSWQYFSVDAKILVYPRPEGHQSLPFTTGQGDQSALSAETSGRDDFAGLKNFRPGEPLHGIAWKALARDDVMRSKQFQGQHSPEIWLAWQAVETSDHEQRISQLSRWVVDAHAQGLFFGMQLPTETISPAYGDAHYHQCLRSLALLPYAD